MKHEEYQLQKSICRYLNLQYPKVFFISDTIANVKLTVSQASRNKAIQKSGFKCPDLIIFEPRGEYSGLFIELKKESPFKKDMTLKSNQHLKEQSDTMYELNKKGYKCHFAWTFYQAKQIIDNYLLYQIQH